MRFLRKLEHVVVGDKDSIDDAAQKMNDAASAFRGNSEQLARVLGEGSARTQAADMQRQAAAYLAEHDKLAALAGEGKQDDARAVLKGGLQQMLDRLNVQLSKLLAGGMQASQEAARPRKSPTATWIYPPAPNSRPARWSKPLRRWNS